jgi:hypothetical protein
MPLECLVMSSCAGLSAQDRKRRADNSNRSFANGRREELLLRIITMGNAVTMVKRQTHKIFFAVPTTR